MKNQLSLDDGVKHSLYYSRTFSIVLQLCKNKTFEKSAADWGGDLRILGSTCWPRAPCPILVSVHLMQGELLAPEFNSEWPLGVQF